MKRILLTSLLLLSSLSLAEYGVPEYEILITQQGLGVKGNVTHEWRDTIWTTINRYYDEMYYQYLNGDELEFRITELDGDVYYMWGCVMSGKLYIYAANPLYCPEEYEHA